MPQIKVMPHARILAKKAPSQRDGGGTINADPGRAGRVEQGEAPPGKSAPRGGPQVQLSRTQLKTCSKSKASDALVQPLENIPCIYQGFCRGGMPPVLAPRMFEIFEDAWHLLLA